MTNVDVSASRVAIVVGAGGGLGRATVFKLAGQGLTVVAVDRNPLGMKGFPKGVTQELVDATDPLTAVPLVERIVHEVGFPTILVNTLGAFEQGNALTTSPDLLRLMIDVNLGPALWLSQAVAPYMQRGGSGAIVNITARPGIEPAAGMTAYSVSKAALVHLTRVLDLEFRPLGIRVNAVAPQLIATDRNREFLPAEALTHAVTPEAIAGVVAFLVSDAAAPVSGAVLPAYGA
jgi:NAD(P)-dependent dehydrogenase (short-subunit alcohol dehydrogenase family)